MTTPFFYIIQHIDSGKRYAGVKFAKGCHPSDIMTKYFTSSNVVKNMLNENRDNFKVIKTIQFTTKEEAIEFEEFFLREVDADTSDDWLNQAVGKAINPDIVKQSCINKYGVDNWMKSEDAKSSRLGFKSGNTYGCFKRSEETKQKMSVAFTGRVYSAEHNDKVSKARTGSKASEETKQKMSLSRTGKSRPKSFSDKMSVLMKGENNPMFGKSSNRKGIKDPQIECEHCGKLANKGNYNRWHGSRCKMKK